MLLLVDNYDSFTYNLKQYLSVYKEIFVIKNDDPNLFLLAESAEAIVLSPGPGHPKDAGKILELINQFIGQKPILGICLGHQALAECLGGRLNLANHVMHGKQSWVTINDHTSLFKGIDSPTQVMRYHSLVVTDLPENIAIIARSNEDNEIMAFHCPSLKVYAMQFHPESIGSIDGMKMIENFLRLIND